MNGVSEPNSQRPGPIFFIAKAKSVVEAGGTATVPVGGGFGVRAADAAGCAIVFEEINAADR